MSSKSDRAWEIEGADINPLALERTILEGIPVSGPRSASLCVAGIYTSELQHTAFSAAQGEKGKRRKRDRGERTRKKGGGGKRQKEKEGKQRGKERRKGKEKKERKLQQIQNAPAALRRLWRSLRRRLAILMALTVVMVKTPNAPLTGMGAMETLHVLMAKEGAAAAPIAAEVSDGAPDTAASGGAACAHGAALAAADADGVDNADGIAAARGGLRGGRGRGERRFTDSVVVAMFEGKGASWRK